MAGDLAGASSATRGSPAHVQIAGVPERHEPDTGEVNYPYLFDLLDRLGYAGWVGCEYFPAGGTEAGLGWAVRHGIRPRASCSRPAASGSEACAGRHRPLRHVRVGNQVTGATLSASGRGRAAGASGACCAASRWSTSSLLGALLFGASALRQAAGAETIVIDQPTRRDAGRSSRRSCSADRFPTPERARSCRAWSTTRCCCARPTGAASSRTPWSSAPGAEDALLARRGAAGADRGRAQGLPRGQSRALPQPADRDPRPGLLRRPGTRSRTICSSGCAPGADFRGLGDPLYMLGHRLARYSARDLADLFGADIARRDLRAARRARGRGRSARPRACISSGSRSSSRRRVPAFEEVGDWVREDWRQARQQADRSRASSRSCASATGSWSRAAEAVRAQPMSRCSAGLVGCWSSCSACGSAPGRRAHDIGVGRRRSRSCRAGRYLLDVEPRPGARRRLRAARACRRAARSSRRRRGGRAGALRCATPSRCAAPAARRRATCCTCPGSARA